MTDQTTTQPTEKFTFKSWYEKNKERLAQKKREKYHTDVNYRTAALRRSAEQRGRRQSPDPEGYIYTIDAVANMLGMSVWTVREWRRKDYFPEPKHRQGRLWFNEQQVLLLSKLREFLSARGGRNKEGLENLKALIYANWN
jgi:phytoene dehydrogenase-like protein